jgi:hypothetical protein
MHKRVSALVVDVGEASRDRSEVGVVQRSARKIASAIFRQWTRGDGDAE